MIVFWLLSALFVTVGGVFSWTSTNLPTPPSFWTDATNAVSSWWTIVPNPVKYFLPIGPVIVAGAAYFALSAALGILALIRRVLLAVIP